MELAHIHLQYDRLKRHHQLALAGGDEIAFLDLAHALRIWVELKTPVTAFAMAHGISLGLPHHTPSKFIKRSLEGATHISMPLASGVESPGVQIQGIRITNRALSSEEIKRRAMAGPPVATVSHMNFAEWLAAGVVEVPSETDGHPHAMLSREMLIKRVANVLGASHPAGSENADEFENRFDNVVLQLHSLRVANGYPSTYYQLLEIAGQIVKKLESIRAIAP